MPNSVTQQLYSSDVLASIALLTILAAIQLILSRALRQRGDLTQPIVRRWSANTRNFLMLVALVGLIMIWAPQLRTFALSLTAFAVAVVVAMKELILCLSGSALRTFTRAYAVGDFIELGGTRGEVLDHNLLVTRLAEFERREGSMLATGREVILPHSLLFGTPLRVEAAVAGQLRHTIQLTFEPKGNLFAAQSEIRKAVLAVMGEGGGKVTDRVEVALSTSDIGKYRVEIKFPVTPNLVGQTEQAVICAVGNLAHGLRDRCESDADDTIAKTTSGGSVPPQKGVI